MQMHAAGGMGNEESSPPMWSAGHDCRKLVVTARKAESGPALGRVRAATCERLQEVANRLGVRRLVNLGRCPAR